jgi:cellulose synthase (UDP-forming)
MNAWDGKASYLSFFSINFRALWTVLKGEKVKFHVTPKERQEGNFLHLVIPQITIVVLTLLGIAYSAYRTFVQGQIQDMPMFIVNVFWGMNNVFCMLPMIRAALWTPADGEQSDEAPAAVLSPKFSA